MSCGGFGVLSRYRSWFRHYATSLKVAGSIRGYWIFQLTKSFQPQYDPGVNSTSNRNEYQESSRGIRDSRCVRLTTSQPSLTDFLENVRASTSNKPMCLDGPLQAQLYLSFSSRGIIMVLSLSLPGRTE
jgi:hypothetical protein